MGIYLNPGSEKLTIPRQSQIYIDENIAITRTVI